MAVNIFDLVFLRFAESRDTHILSFGGNQQVAFQKIVPVFIDNMKLLISHTLPFLDIIILKTCSSVYQSLAMSFEKVVVVASLLT